MVIDVSDTGNGSFFDLTTNVSAIMPPHKPRFVVYLELEIIGGSSKLGIQALSKLDLVSPPHNVPSETPSKKDDQYKTYADYAEDMILHNSEKTIPEELTPVKRREFVDSILNDLKVRHRFVSRRWPRPKAVPDWKDLNPPPYQIIDPENPDFPPGKMAPNGMKLWGSTLLDFYKVEKIPGLSDQCTILTGSQLLGWCKANGEYDNGVAKQCISWAEEEKDPEVVPVYNISNLIRDLENSAFDEDEEQKGTKEDADVPDAKGAFVLPQPWPPTSAFDSTGYLGPWADAVPFSTSGPWCFKTLPVLEEYIPQSRLPKKLIVHDPCEVLWADGREQAPESSGCVYEYELRLSDTPRDTKRREEDEEDLVKRGINDKRILDNFLANPHSSTTRPHGLEIRESNSVPINVPTKPAIYVVLPPCPPLAAANEGHLYLSSEQFVGQGNHSFVYRAEWELPRSCLVEERICIDCVMEDLGAILREEDGENGETRDRRWDELSGKMVAKETSIPQHLMTTEGAITGKDADDTYVIREGQQSTEIVYEGPYRVIHSRVKYQNLARAAYCEHFQKAKNSVHPLTTKVQVTAKLSVEGDTHLVNEAQNYQRFPKHWFEHWSGYNLLPPLDDPTPVGPLVPQFYGYYVPKQGVVEGDTTKRYLSPILLIEHCGNPIPEGLSIDDRHECIALAFRLQKAKWFHGSFARRNILRKPGPLSVHPKDREANEKKRNKYGMDWSFRLIDFGRSAPFNLSPMYRLEREDDQLQNWYKGNCELDD